MCGLCGFTGEIIDLSLLHISHFVSCSAKQIAVLKQKPLLPVRHKANRTRHLFDYLAGIKIPYYNFLVGHAASCRCGELPELSVEIIPAYACAAVRR